MQATINGATIFYTDTGTAGAAPVLFVHAFPMNHDMWAPQAGALQGRFRVITCDVRGHGQSPPGSGQYTLETFVDDLIGLLDHLKIDRVVGCGLSMGGYILLRAVERNPDRFRALVLADTRSEADSNEGKLKRGAAIKTVQQQGPAAYADGFAPSLFAPDTFKSKPGTVETVKQFIRANSPAGICGALLAMAARTDTTAALAAVRVPVLVLVGEHDVLTPPAAAASMREKIPHSEMYVLPQAGHMSNLENPEAFNTHLLAFLARV